MLGDAGIHDCTAILDDLEISHAEGPAFAASHGPECADLVPLSTVMSGGSPNYVRLDDWMLCESDKIDVFDLLAIAIKQLPAEQQEKVVARENKYAM